MDLLREAMRMEALHEMLYEGQQRGDEAMVSFIRRPLPQDMQGSTSTAMEAPSSQPCPGSFEDDMDHRGSTAPPLRAVLPVRGWLQQTQASPWRPVSPNTIATFNKYKNDPTTFSWIVQNDAQFVKWVLDHTDDLSDDNMKLMHMYFREHYQKAVPGKPMSSTPTLPYIPTSHEAAMSVPEVTPPINVVMAQMQILVDQMQELAQQARGHRGVGSVGAGTSASSAEGR